MAYASVEDLEARWRELAPDEQNVAEALIADASAMLAQLMGDSMEADPDITRMVVCNMVKRSMGAGDSFGISQQSMTAGPYTQQWSVANPAGDMYLTKTERKLLGISTGYIGSIRPMVGGDEHDPWN